MVQRSVANNRSRLVPLSFRSKCCIGRVVTARILSGRADQDVKIGFLFFFLFLFFSLKINFKLDRACKRKTDYVVG